jgi:hypothetical protein
MIEVNFVFNFSVDVTDYFLAILPIEQCHVYIG